MEGWRHSSFVLRSHCIYFGPQQTEASPRGRDHVPGGGGVRDGRGPGRASVHGGRTAAVVLVALDGCGPGRLGTSRGVIRGDSGPGRNGIQAAGSQQHLRRLRISLRLRLL